MIALLLALQLWQYDNGSFGGLPAYVVVTPSNCQPLREPAGQIIVTTTLAGDAPVYLHTFCYGERRYYETTPGERP